LRHRNLGKARIGIAHQPQKKPKRTATGSTFETATGSTAC
jgi:hypothetical protein